VSASFFFDLTTIYHVSGAVETNLKLINFFSRNLESLEKAGHIELQFYKDEIK
jgi:hypothetical protein